MTSDRFADRLDPATYREDEVVGVYEDTPGDADPVHLNQQRCISLLDELVFVAERLDDPAAATTAQAIQDYVAVRVRRPGWTGEVTFDAN